MRNTTHARTPSAGKRRPAEEAVHCLCLNAAEGLLQCVIARREAAGPATLLCAQAWHAPSQGAELLAPALADALARLGLTPRDIGRIACVRGPGSFTGIRLTLATAAGLARSVGAEQAGVDYLPLLAYSALRRLGELLAWRDKTAAEEMRARPIWTLTHARKNLIHAQGFHSPLPPSHGPDARFAPLPISDILVFPPREAALHIRARWEEKRDGPGAPILLGSGLSRNHADIAAVFAAAHTERAGNPTAEEDDRAAAPVPLLLPPDFDHPSPEALLACASHVPSACGDIEPLYVRPADAEDNLERIALSLGLDPDQARAKLNAIRQPPR